MTDTQVKDAIKTIYKLAKEHGLDKDAKDEFKDSLEECLKTTFLKTYTARQLYDREKRSDAKQELIDEDSDDEVSPKVWNVNSRLKENWEKLSTRKRKKYEERATKKTKKPATKKPLNAYQKFFKKERKVVADLDKIKKIKDGRKRQNKIMKEVAKRWEAKKEAEASSSE